MKSSGDSTPALKGCDLTPPTRTQASEQDCCHFMADNRQSSTPRSCNTSQIFDNAPGHLLSRGGPNMCTRFWHAPKIFEILLES